MPSPLTEGTPSEVRKSDEGGTCKVVSVVSRGTLSAESGVVEGPKDPEGHCLFAEGHGLFRDGRGLLRRRTGGLWR